VLSVFVPALNGLQVGMQFSSGGDVNQNTFWVKRSVAWDAAGITTMLAAFKTWFVTGDGANYYKLIMSSDVSLVSISGRDFTTQHGLTSIYQTGLPIVGGHAVPQIQLGCTKAFTARTGLAGKSYRGRVFTVGIPTDQASAPDAGTVLAAYNTSMSAALSALIPAVTAADADSVLVVCSRYYQPGGPNTPTLPRATAVMTPITSFGYHDLNVDFQRRRAPGHARHH